MIFHLRSIRRFHLYEAISLKTCVEKRNTTGAPGVKPMQEAVDSYKKYMEEY